VQHTVVIIHWHRCVQPPHYCTASRSKVRTGMHWDITTTPFSLPP
jgi:hypothetical protein